MSTPNGGINGTLGNGLIAHWGFDNGSLLDESGNGREFTKVLNPLPCNDKDGISNNAYNNIGANGLLRIDSSFITTVEKTFSGWFKYSKNSELLFVYSVTDIEYSTQWTPGISIDGNGYLSIFFNGLGSFTSSAIVPKNEWFNLVYVQHSAGGRFEVYINDVLFISGQALLQPHIAFYIGSAWYSSNIWVDEIRMYDRDITTSEVTELYEMGVNYTPEPVNQSHSFNEYFLNEALIETNFINETNSEYYYKQNFNAQIRIKNNFLKQDIITFTKKGSLYSFDTTLKENTCSMPYLISRLFNFILTEGNMLQGTIKTEDFNEYYQHKTNNEIPYIVYKNVGGDIFYMQKITCEEQTTPADLSIDLGWVNQTILDFIKSSIDISNISIGFFNLIEFEKTNVNGIEYWKTSNEILNNYNNQLFYLYSNIPNMNDAFVLINSLGFVVKEKDYDNIDSLEYCLKKQKESFPALLKKYEIRSDILSLVTVLGNNFIQPLSTSNNYSKMSVELEIKYILEEPIFTNGDAYEKFLYFNTSVAEIIFPEFSLKNNRQKAVIEYEIYSNPYSLSGSYDYFETGSDTVVINYMCEFFNTEYNLEIYYKKIENIVQQINISKEFKTINYEKHPKLSIKKIGDFSGRITLQESKLDDLFLSDIIKNRQFTFVRKIMCNELNRSEFFRNCLISLDKTKAENELNICSCSILFNKQCDSTEGDQI